VGRGRARSLVKREGERNLFFCRSKREKRGNVRRGNTQKKGKEGRRDCLVQRLRAGRKEKKKGKHSYLSFSGEEKRNCPEGQKGEGSGRSPMHRPKGKEKGVEGYALHFFGGGGNAKKGERKKERDCFFHQLRGRKRREFLPVIPQRRRRRKVVKKKESERGKKK